MSKDQIEQEVKELYLRGPGVPLPAKIEELLKNRDDCLIVGDGKNPIDPDELKKILKEKKLKITSNTRIDINVHGERYDDIEETIDEQGNKVLKKGQYNGQHTNDLFKDTDFTIDSFDILQEIAGTNTPLYIHLWSCYGGSANKVTEFLPPQSILVTHIEAKEAESTSLMQYSVNESLERYLDPRNNNLTPHQQFILDIQENFEAATFNQATKDGPKKFKFTRIPKEKYMADVLQQIDQHQTIDGFVRDFFAKEGNRFQNDFPYADVQDVIDIVSNVDKQIAERFAQGVLVHAFKIKKQNSIENIAKLLEKLQNKGIDINTPPNNDMNALHWAVVYNNTNKVELLLNHKADLNIKDNNCYTPLRWAVTENHPDILEQLIKAGADLNIKDNNGYTPLHWAAVKNHPDILEQLIKAGANLNNRNKDGLTALHVAAAKNHPDILEQLIKAGADLNIQDNDGYTPLHWAVTENHPDILKQLIEAETNLNIKDLNGQTPLDIAIIDNNKNIIQILNEAIEKQNKKNHESLQEAKEKYNNITIPTGANNIFELSEETKEKDNQNTKVINELANYLTNEIQGDKKITPTHETEMKDTVEKLLSSVSDNNIKETSETIVKESIQATKEKLSVSERLAKMAKIISKHLSKVKRIKKILKNSGIIEKLKVNKKKQEVKTKFPKNQPNKNHVIKR